jgi:hypothetical protein
MSVNRADFDSGRGIALVGDGAYGKAVEGPGSEFSDCDDKWPRPYGDGMGRAVGAVDVGDIQRVGGNPG